MDGRRCNVDAPDRANAAGFYAASCWLVTLLLWELSYLPNLQWDDWVHHVITAVMLTWYNDDTIQTKAGSDGDVNPKISQNPAVSAMFFVMLLGASVACFNCMLCATLFCRFRGLQVSSHM
eukprot:m.134244 g.134244  ORF g.134244 m.134244 type:complete len:121 (+) comp13859_c0_seq2:941-1303(+)